MCFSLPFPLYCIFIFLRETNCRKVIKETESPFQLRSLHGISEKEIHLYCAYKSQHIFSIRTKKKASRYNVICKYVFRMVILFISVYIHKISQFPQSYSQQDFQFNVTFVLFLYIYIFAKGRNFIQILSTPKLRFSRIIYL